MAHRGVCPSCQHQRWVGEKSGVCRPCNYRASVCSNCGKVRKLYVEKLCYCCYQHRQVEKRLDQITCKFKPSSKYNEYLFQLYLRYVKRYRLAYFHLKQTEDLLQVFERDHIAPLLSWEDVLKYSAKYSLWHPNKKANGCAFLKIGYMLQELGVIGLRRDDAALSIKCAIARFPTPNRDWVQSYVNRLGTLGMTSSTILNHLRIIRDFTSWYAITYPELSILKASPSKVIEYAAARRARSCSLSTLRFAILGLGRFYAWLKYLGLITENPCAELKPGRAEAKIVICSDAQLKGLMKYIISGTADPEGAFILSLVLFYGVTTEELAKAQIAIENEKLTIIFERQPRSYGRHYHNRGERLTLPQSPLWFQALQKRFCKSWSEQYEKTKKTFPIPRLLLPKHHHSTRPLCDLTLTKRIHQATVAATGLYIPLKILRQTCGHLYSQSGDGSLLTHLGWSPQFAFHYTWLPRRITSGHPIPKNLLK